jgi:hypothetical protein
MKYDDMEMLRSLTITHNVTAGQNSTTPYRSFEGLTEDEIHALAMQKHAEMTVRFNSLSALLTHQFEESQLTICS